MGSDRLDDADVNSFEVYPRVIRFRPLIHACGFWGRVGIRRRIGGMGKKNQAGTFEVNCPCCNAKLTIDGELGVVLSHVPAVKSGPNVDFGDTARLLREQREAVEAKFLASVEHERTKEDVLARKFAEGLKKAKDGPAEKPLRDFDLD
jgi:hypothetical protein